MPAKEETSGGDKAQERWSGGTMRCYLTNQTGRAITDAYLAHEWDGDRQAVAADWMDPGERKELPIRVGGGGHDLWTVRFTDATDTGTWHRNRKQCDVTSGDYDSGQPVYINLGPGRQGWSVVLPDSSSCWDNYYDAGP